MCQREESGNKQLIKAKPDFFPFFFFLVVYMFLVLKNGIWQQQQNSLQKEIRYLVTLNSGQIMARYIIHLTPWKKMAISTISIT